jgi:hypothetical protein
MSIRLAVALVGLVFGVAVPAFAEQKDAVDPKIDQQIRLLAAKYDEAINRRDAAAVAALYAQDGVWVTHDGAFNGRSKKATLNWILSLGRSAIISPRLIG